jgi:hypothetical protein
MLYEISLGSAFSLQNRGSLQGASQVIEFAGISTKYASGPFIPQSELTI